MKNLILLFVFTCLSITVQAQSHPFLTYSFSVKEEPYRTLDLDYNDYVEIDDLGDWNSVPIPLEFDFEFGEKTFSELQVHTDGEITFEDIDNNPDVLWSVAVLANNLLDKSENSSENSTLRFVVDGGEWKTGFENRIS